MILFDTHVWIFWLQYPQHLSRNAQNTIKNSDQYAISVFSCLETAMLTHKGRLEVGPSLDTWMSEATSVEQLNILAITPEIAAKAYQLPEFHGDPADRVIAATAIALDIPLLTKDRKIHEYHQLHTVW